ncbi:glycerate kinase [Staphylococcus aureus]
MKNSIIFAHIAQIDITNIRLAIKEVTFKVACDVSNPLLGENGATYIYGPQKGADAKMIPKLDFAMSHYHDKIKMCTGKSVNQMPSLWCSWRYGRSIISVLLNKFLTKGIDVVLSITRFIKELKMPTSLLLQQRMDYQTIFGKTPVGVGWLPKQYHIPVVTRFVEVSKLTCLRFRYLIVPIL